VSKKQIHELEVLVADAEQELKGLRTESLGREVLNVNRPDTTTEQLKSYKDSLVTHNPWLDMGDKVSGYVPDGKEMQQQL
jgi:hypothetical protein